MEEQFKNIDKFTSDLVKEAGIQMPSADFFNNVMMAVERTSIKEAYKPLISKNLWFVIGALFIALMAVLYFSPLSQLAFISDLNLTEKLSLENPLANIKFSKTLVYGIGFLGLFIAQIPFLKYYYIEKSY